MKYWFAITAQINNIISVEAETEEDAKGQIEDYIDEADINDWDFDLEEVILTNIEE